MERSRHDGGTIYTNGVGVGVGVGGGSGVSKFTPVSLQQPDYSSKAVQDALKHLASIDLIDLCNEAKLERCRASRDLRSCGRLVESVLTSCGHASLCAECSQRSENCPLCRVPLPKNGSSILRPRLYYECVEAGLILKSFDEKSQEKEDDETLLSADVLRLYSLFDVAMENSLCCLICEYVTDVCMDKSAVSSDPVIAFLLDEVVVKDWCKRTFKNILEQVQGIYSLETNEMETNLGVLLKYSENLTGLSNVLEVLDLSFKDTQSAKLDDLYHLQESILKTKQHVEMMMWCIRHQFLESIRSRHGSLPSWRALMCERKSAAVTRAWPETYEHSEESNLLDNSSLFIEDALSNLEVDKTYERSSAFELEIASLQKDGGSSYFRSKIEGLGCCYPFENVRAAVDTLFLCGVSDMVVAKRAIFLYYLFDRHWTIADEEWRGVVDDFATTFGITRHSLLESFTYYLLDDPSDEALQEACRLLPEISGPESHPKIAKVLLERGNPDAALMFLRWSGRDGGAELISLSEAVTAVRVRVECALLTEAFMYQRTVCLKAKEKQTKHKLLVENSYDSEVDAVSWTDWVLVLVSEICFLCIRRNLVNHLLELPWDSDEEKHLHKCLFDYAAADPCSTAGSLLVVYYLQRHRYIDAYHVDCDIRTVEEDFISNNDIDEEILYKMSSSAQWRAGLVNKALEFLPEVERCQLKAGKLPCQSIVSGDGIDYQREVDRAEQQREAAPESSLLLPMEQDTSSGLSSSRILEANGHFGYNDSEFSRLAVPFKNSLSNSERLSKPPMSSDRKFKLDDMSSRRNHSTSARSIKHFRRTSTSFQSDLQNASPEQVPPEVEQNKFYGQFPKTSPPNSRRVMAKPTRTPGSNRGLLDDSPEDVYKTAFSKRFLPGDQDRQGTVTSSEDLMDISRSQENGTPTAEWKHSNGAQRWRSDENSDEEGQAIAETLMGASPHTTLRRSSRLSSRLTRR